MKKQMTYRQYANRKKRRGKALAVLAGVLAFIIVAGLVTLGGYIILKPRLGAVHGLKVRGVAVSTVELEWDRLSNAEGYFLYSKSGTEKYKKVADVTETSYKFRNLNQATEYDFRVVAHNDEITSDKKAAVSAFTYPEKPSITLARSKSEGTADIQWQKNTEADEYVLRYKPVTEESYAAENTLRLSVDEGSTIQLEELTPDLTYDVSMRTIVRHRDEVYRSEWSKARVTIHKDAPEKKVNPGQKMIALTFDDGPSYNKASDRILDTLEKYDAKATFFMIGENAESLPKNVKRKAKLGMEIGSHSWDHTHYGEKVTDDDISKANEAIMKITGKFPTAFRSPGGITSKNILKKCKKENLPVYYWSIDTADWQTRKAKTTVDRVIKNAEDGDIVLMHEIYEETADAVEKIVPKLIKKGFKLVTCAELIEAKTGEKPQAGVEYFSGK